MTAPRRWAGRLKPIKRNALPAMSKHTFNNVFGFWIKIETADKRLRGVKRARNNEGEGLGGAVDEPCIVNCCWSCFVINMHKLSSIVQIVVGHLLFNKKANIATYSREKSSLSLFFKLWKWAKMCGCFVT